MIREHLDVVLEPNWPAFMQPMRFVKMLSSYPNVTPVPIRFVAKLDPPVPAANVIVRKLMVASGIADDGMFIAYLYCCSKDSYSDISFSTYITRSIYYHIFSGEYAGGKYLLSSSVID